MGHAQHPQALAVGARGTVTGDEFSIVVKVVSIREGVIKVAAEEPIYHRDVLRVDIGTAFWFRHDRLGFLHEVEPEIASGRFAWTRSGRMLILQKDRPTKR